MKAMTYLPLVGIALAWVGCKAADTAKVEDAGQPSRQDSAAPAPDLPFEDLAPVPDLAIVPDLPPDLAPDIALLVKEDSAPDSAPDLATTPDTAPDSAPPEVPTRQDTAPDSAVGDAARDSTLPAPDLASFCTGGASRMVVNGISSNPTVTGKAILYDSGEGGEFQVVTATFEQPIIVAWQAAAGAFTGFKTIDLASPPSGWSVRLTVGCGSQSGCTTEVDSYTSGLGGSLSVNIGKRAMYEMSVCLHVEEPMSSPHPVVHALDLFATHIEAN
jgi:hypothetical protein